MELLQFLTLLVVLVESGYDIRYAWEVAARIRPAFLGKEDFEAGFSGHLAARRVLAEGASERFWWEGLKDLYGAQSPLTPYLRAWTRHLAAGLSREMDEHLRMVPTQLNLLLILFNLPPLFLLLFGPLLLSMQWLR